MQIQQLLAEKIAALKSLDLAKSRLEKLEARIVVAHQKLQELQFILEKEYKDVEKLEQLSVRVLFEKILGDKQSQLEKERQEYLIAVLNFNEAKKSLELMDFERNVLLKKLENYNKTKSELHNLIRQREKSLILEDKLAQQLIIDINKDLDKAIALKRELHEAIDVALKIDGLINEIVSNLNQVIMWGEYSFNRPDIHIRKMVYINRARDNAYQIKQLLQQFEDELMDIYSDQEVEIQTALKTFRQFIQAFFENLISDWIIFSKIENAISTIEDVDDIIQELLGKLQVKLATVESTINDLNKKKKHIILSLN